MILKYYFKKPIKQGVLVLWIRFEHVSKAKNVSSMGILKEEWGQTGLLNKGM